MIGESKHSTRNNTNHNRALLLKRGGAVVMMIILHAFALCCNELVLLTLQQAHTNINIISIQRQVIVRWQVEELIKS